MKGSDRLDRKQLPPRVVEQIGDETRVEHMMMHGAIFEVPPASRLEGLAIASKRIAP